MEREIRECPEGHGPMNFYASAPEDDVDDFFECPDCGSRQVVYGQRSAESDDTTEDVIPERAVEMAVYKYMLPIDDLAVVEMARGARILCIDTQSRSDHVASQPLFVWALVDTSAPKVKRLFRVAGTGHMIADGDSSHHVATVQMMGGGMVWHVFDCGEYETEEALVSARGPVAHVNA